MSNGRDAAPVARDAAAFGEAERKAASASVIDAQMATSADDCEMNDGRTEEHRERKQRVDASGFKLQSQVVQGAEPWALCDHVAVYDGVAMARAAARESGVGSAGFAGESTAGKVGMADEAAAVGAAGAWRALALFSPHGSNAVAAEMERHFLSLLVPRIVALGAVPDDAGPIGRPEFDARLRRVAHDAVLEFDARVAESKERDDPGATFMVALIEPRCRGLWTIHAGDVRAVLVDVTAGYRVALETRDHCFEDPREVERAQAAGGVVRGSELWFDNLGTGFARAIGNQFVKRRMLSDFSFVVDRVAGAVSAAPDISSVALVSGHAYKLVLGSRAIWETFSSANLAAWLSARPLRFRSAPDGPLRFRSAPDGPLRVRSAPDGPLRVRSAPDGPSRVRSAPDGKWAAFFAAWFREAAVRGLCPKRFGEAPDAGKRAAAHVEAADAIRAMGRAPERDAHVLVTMASATDPHKMGCSVLVASFAAA